MKKLYILSMMLFFGVNGFTQLRTNLAIGGQISTSSAFLDASSTSTWNTTQNIGKGLIFPRVDLIQFTTLNPSTGGIGLPTNYPSRFDGMVVYNTVSGTATIGSTPVSPGFYYYSNQSGEVNGGSWIRLLNNNDLLLKEDLANKSTDITLSENSDVNYPTEKAVKSYVDSQIAVSTIGAVMKTDYTANTMLLATTNATPTAATATEVKAFLGISASSGTTTTFEYFELSSDAAAGMGTVTLSATALTDNAVNVMASLNGSQLKPDQYAITGATITLNIPVFKYDQVSVVYNK